MAPQTNDEVPVVVANCYSYSVPARRDRSRRILDHQEIDDENFGAMWAKL